MEPMEYNSRNLLGPTFENHVMIEFVQKFWCLCLAQPPSRPMLEVHYPIGDETRYLCRLRKRVTGSSVGVNLELEELVVTAGFFHLGGHKRYVVFPQVFQFITIIALQPSPYQFRVQVFEPLVSPSKSPHT
jgi:hypothetical protein